MIYLILLLMNIINDKNIIISTEYEKVNTRKLTITSYK